MFYYVLMLQMSYIVVWHGLLSMSFNVKNAMTVNVINVMT